MIDRVTRAAHRPLYETPVGFKWFVDGLLDGSLGFGGEESAGASCLRLDGTEWSTDKDGIVLALLAAEMTARMDRDPAEIYRQLTQEFGDPHYERIEAPVTPAGKAALLRLSPDAIHSTSARRRADPDDPHQSAGKRRAIWRREGDRRERLVRGAAVGHREHLQDLRGELPRRGAPAPHPVRSARSSSTRRSAPPAPSPEPLAPASNLQL